MQSGIEITGSPLAVLAYHRDLILLLATFGGMLVLMAIEQLAPRRSEDTAPALRWLMNWGIAAFNFFAMIYLALWLGRWLNGVSFTPPFADAFAVLPLAPALLIVFVVIEGLTYFLHRLYHSVPALWYFHSVHHGDGVLDATTSHRHHLGEVVLNSMALLPVLVLFGVPAGLLVAATLLRLPVILWSHGNISFPRPLERALQRWVVTPDFHRVHHASERRLHDSNYATALPLFDDLFGTAQRLSTEELRDLPIGIDKSPTGSRVPAL